MDSEDRDNADCVAAICKCGNAVFVSVSDRLDRTDRRELGTLAAAGCDVKHLPAKDARKLSFGCKCR